MLVIEYEDEDRNGRPGAYPLMPVTVIPWMNCFWVKKKRTMTGAMTIAEAIVIAHMLTTEINPQRRVHRRRRGAHTGHGIAPGSTSQHAPTHVTPVYLCPNRAA